MTRRDLAINAILVAAYFIAVRIGLSLALLQPVVSAFWPAAGIALATLLIFGPRILPGIWLGALLGNLSTQVPPVGSCIGIASGDTLEALVGYYAISRFAGGRHALERPLGVVYFVLLGCLVAPVIAAAIGVTSLALGGAARLDALPSLWATWWLGDATGILVAAPVLLTWDELRCQTWDRGRMLEALAWLVATAGASYAVFGPVNWGHAHVSFVPVPLLVWGAFRFGLPGAAAGALLVATIANVGTLGGWGPFAQGNMSTALAPLQLFMGCTAVPSLLIAAVVRQRAQAMEEIQRGHALLLAQQEGTVEGILVVDARGCVLSANRRFHELWDVPAELKEPGTHDEQLLALVKERFLDWEAFTARLHYLYEHPLETSHDELRLVDGRVIDRYSTPALAPDGRPYGRIWYFRDVTADKQLQATLQAQNEELLKLDRLKTEFVNVVSHELRTPLTSLVGFAEFLEDGIAGPLGPDQAAYVEQIQENARRLAMLVDDLLDFSRLQAGTLKLNFQEVDLGSAVEGAVATLTPQARQAEVDLQAWLPETPQVLLIAPDRIGQVLLNLVGNAVKFTPRGGRVVVRLTPTDEGARVEVTDTGIGIDAAHLPHLFERFYQVDPSMTRARGGVGLGLAISKAIIEAHGGHIGVESQPGEGSTFWFTLPKVPLPANLASRELSR